MPNARSTYGGDGTLRTVTDAPDNTFANLGRELVSDRRSDYDERRTHRATERPYGSVAPPRPLPQGAVTPAALGSGGPNTNMERAARDAALRAQIIASQESTRQAPLIMAPADMTGLSTGRGYTLDPNSMSASQRQMFLPQNSQMTQPIGDAEDPGWLNFVALSQYRQQKDRGL